MKFDRELTRPAKANGAKHGAPMKFTPEKKAQAKKLLKLKRQKTLTRVTKSGKPLVVWRPVHNKIAIAEMVGVSVGTLHNWIAAGMK